MNRPTPAAKVPGSPSLRPANAPSPTHAFAAALATILAVAACTEGRGAQDPSQQPGYDPNNPYAQPQQGQYPPQQGQYPQQGPYPQQQPAPYPQQGPYPQQQPAPYPSQQGQYPQATPTATAPASPLALPCQNDLICGTHKCNLTAQRCAFPCAANTDCASGFSCMGAGTPTALCVPGGG